eukprot:8766432-Pyramimonas_sp.AAC.1
MGPTAATTTTKKSFKNIVSICWLFYILLRICYMSYTSRELLMLDNTLLRIGSSWAPSLWLSGLRGGPPRRDSMDAARTTGAWRPRE